MARSLIQSETNPMPSLLRDVSAPCCHKGCTRAAAWYPVVMLWAKGHGKSSKPMRCEVGLQFCHQHKDEFKVSDVPFIHTAAKITAEDMGLVEPDIETAEVEMIPFIT